MKKHTAGVLAVLVAAGLIAAAGCSMAPPKVVYPDGTDTVPANNPQRMLAIQSARDHSRAMLTENEMLRAEVAAMRQQLADIRGAVATVLAQRVNPAPVLDGSPAPPVVPVAPAVEQKGTASERAPILPPAAAPDALPKPLSQGSLNLIAVPRHVLSDGRDLRHARYYVRTFGTDETRFTLDAAALTSLLAVAAESPAIQIQGATDSAVADLPNQQVAQARATHARQLLIEAGIESSKIRTRVFAAGYFAAPNDTPEGRAQNRRVEIIFYRKAVNPSPQGA
jgi:outer membrane protein OmpA-like peptidoglycan-associated protein